MKVLCVCHGGNVRSVGLKSLLQTRVTVCYDALACGVISNSDETIEMLCAWADAIVIMHPSIRKSIPPKYAVLTYDVGEDVWGNAFHPDLQAKLEKMVKERGDFA